MNVKKSFFWLKQLPLTEGITVIDILVEVQTNKCPSKGNPDPKNYLFFPWNNSFSHFSPHFSSETTNFLQLVSKKLCKIKRFQWNRTWFQEKRWKMLSGFKWFQKNCQIWKVPFVDEKKDQSVLILRVVILSQKVVLNNQKRDP